MAGEPAIAHPKEEWDHKEAVTKNHRLQIIFFIPFSHRGILHSALATAISAEKDVALYQILLPLAWENEIKNQRTLLAISHVLCMNILNYSR